VRWVWCGGIIGVGGRHDAMQEVRMKNTAARWPRGKLNKERIQYVPVERGFILCRGRVPVPVAFRLPSSAWKSISASHQREFLTKSGVERGTFHQSPASFVRALARNAGGIHVQLVKYILSCPMLSKVTHQFPFSLELQASISEPAFNYVTVLIGGQFHPHKRHGQSIRC
jgi:hypothetical protein